MKRYDEFVTLMGVCLMRDATSPDPYIRSLVRNHSQSTEEIILTTKAMDFLESL